MEHSSEVSSQPSGGTRPLWVRAVVMAAIWTLVLQPVVSSAQLAQSPMFTVTSAPPNVMLMFDDSGSMNRLTLNPPPAYANPTFYGASPSQAILSLNTVGYFGASGIGWVASCTEAQIAGGQASCFYNDRSEFSRADVLARAPAFNPLAYNPMIQYLPWNKDRVRFADASYGGNGPIAAGANVPWDPRNLPTSMDTLGRPLSTINPTGYGSIAQRYLYQAAPALPGVTVPFTATRAGSVFYAGMPDDHDGYWAVAAPSRVDLFSSTWDWDNPNCTNGTQPTLYRFACPAATGTVYAASSGTCSAVGQPSVNGTCCNSPIPGPDTIGSATTYGWRAQGPPGPISPPFSQTCIGGPFYNNATRQVDTTTCAVALVDPLPYDVECSPPSENTCTYDPPPYCPDFVQATEYQWGCTYETRTPTSTCPTATPQLCESYLGTATCAQNPRSATGHARHTGGYWTPARYVTYDPNHAAPLPAANANDPNDLINYRVIMIDRKFGWNSGTGVRDAIDGLSKYRVINAVTGLPAPASARPDCPATQTDAKGRYCTFEQEAQNYANWFTYYRSRLFAAIGVMSEVASELRGPEQYMRMGFGRINHFPDARNPWNASSFSDLVPASAFADLDGQPNPGAIERGVRPFTVYDPPICGTPPCPANLARKDVFDWLFTINGLGPTPNREAMHAAGQYFSRTDSRGPWGRTPGPGAGELPSDHLWCRRNYTLLATDGEWTRLAGQTPRLESMIGGGPNTPLRSKSVDYAQIDGTQRDTGAPLTYTYVAASNPQITGGPDSTTTETLTDVLHYYWATDLRPPGPTGLRNSLITTDRNKAFWQHMSAYIVGYGVNASEDSPTRSPALRQSFWTPENIDWPLVDTTACRQVDNNAEDAAINPGCSLPVDPGNRINDTLRAALTSGGDFFSATSPAALKTSLEAVFAAIGSDNAAGTSPGLSSSTVGAGNLIIQSGFFTNTWHGYIEGYDQIELLDYLRGTTTVKPTAVWTFNVETPLTNRPIYTSTSINSAAAFTWTALPAFQGALGTSAVLDYLRGDTSNELRFNGSFRNRTNGILGDIVQSTPLYSKGADHGYLRRPAAAGTTGANLYGTYVTNKRASRTPVAVFGANDGMLHVLDASRAPATRGKEIFAYVPRSLYPTLNQLSSPAYAHRYYVDGPVIESDVFRGTWKTIAIGTTGAGAAGIFAIDITAPGPGMDTNNVLWDIVPSDHVDGVVQSDLGNVLQPGVIGSVKLNPPDINAPGRWVYMVGNGYDSASGRATLFVFDAFDGSLIKSLRTPVVTAGANGLGGITPVYDGNRNIIAVYGGDKQGNMWKFDFSSGNVNDPDGPSLPKKGWEIFNKAAGSDAPLFTATDGFPSGGAAQPITAAPRITPHGISGVHVGFGTGKLFETGDNTSLQEQAVYVLWDKGQVPTIAKSSLQRIRQKNVDFAAITYRELEGSDLTSYDWTQEGFYIPLRPWAGSPLMPEPLEGERILSAGILDAGVLSFTSFQQQSGGTDLCTPGGTSTVYRFNLIGGLGEAGFLGVTGPVIGRRIQPGLVSAAPPIYEPVAPTGLTVDSMSAADATKMMKNPKYRLQSGRAELAAGALVGVCAHVGLKVDGTVARIPTKCAGLPPLRAWGSGVR